MGRINQNRDMVFANAMQRYMGLLDKGEVAKKNYFEQRKKYIEELERKHEEEQAKKRESNMSHKITLLVQAQEKVSCDMSSSSDFKYREKENKKPERFQERHQSQVWRTT